MRLILAAALALLCHPAAAHDVFGNSDWIGDSHMHNKAGDLCCGFNDCPIVPPADLEDRQAGVYIKSRDELIPYGEVQPSPDGRTYRCAWPTPIDRKCFFHRMPGS